MGKMSMFRTFETNQPCSFTVAMVAIGLFVCFAAYIIEFMILHNPSWKWYVIPVQIIFFILMYWSFLQVYLTDPGSVPKFYAVDKFSYSEQQPRIYCLLCHNFKAQRTHHCSACKRCVLNMDHHCPWINNCIGFYNRKFFILFLFYLTVNILFVLPQQGYLIVNEIIPIIKQQQSTTIHTAIRILVFIFELTILFPISIFTGYHMNLVFQNQTTLTQMKRQREQQRGKQPQVNVYDIGSYHNFRQVFGKKSWQWLLPITKTLPCDGLNWPKNN